MADMRISVVTSPVRSLRAEAAIVGTSAPRRQARCVVFGVDHGCESAGCESRLTRPGRLSWPRSTASLEHIPSAGELDRVDTTTTASGLCGWTRRGLLTVSGGKLNLRVTYTCTLEQRRGGRQGRIPPRGPNNSWALPTSRRIYRRLRLSICGALI